MLIYCHKSFYSLQLHILIPAPLPSPSVPVEPTPDPAEACSVDPGHKPHRSGRVFISSLGRTAVSVFRWPCRTDSGIELSQIKFYVSRLVDPLLRFE